MAIFVGPVAISRLGRDAFRLQLRPVPLGGSVWTGPRRWDGDERFRHDYFWVMVAGPATSLVVGALGLWLTPSSTMAWSWSLISLVIGAGTLIPARYPSGMTTDGEKLLRLGRSGPTDRALVALRMLILTVRPRDWDPALVAVASAESESQLGEAIDATMFLYYRALDSEDVAGAGVLLQRLIDYTCGTARWPRTTVSIEVAIEAGLFEAAWRGDIAAAREWLARAPGSKRGPVKLIAEVLAGRPKGIAKYRRRYPLSHQATLERLSSSSSN